MLLIPGKYYRSKEMLDALGGLKLAFRPHVTPDGHALAIFCKGGRRLEPQVVREGEAPGPRKYDDYPDAFVVVAETGHDLEQVVVEGNNATISRVEFPPGAFDDMERLVEYDHLPENRKDYAVYPRGMKLTQEG